MLKFYNLLIIWIFTVIHNIVVRISFLRWNFFDNSDQYNLWRSRKPIDSS